MPLKPGSSGKRVGEGLWEVQVPMGTKIYSEAPCVFY